MPTNGILLVPMDEKRSPFIKFRQYSLFLEKTVLTENSFCFRSRLDFSFYFFVQLSLIESGIERNLFWIICIYSTYVYQFPLYLNIFKLYGNIILLKYYFVSRHFLIIRKNVLNWGLFRKINWCHSMNQAVLLKTFIWNWNTKFKWNIISKF